MGAMETLLAAANRVDYRLTYNRLDEPRTCHDSGIDGPDIPNAYSGPNSPATGSGCWEDPEFSTAWEAAGGSEEAAIARWFVSAVREVIHEGLEWFRVDTEIYLNPHGHHEMAIHALSEEFANSLLALRSEATA